MRKNIKTKKVNKSSVYVTSIWLLFFILCINLTTPVMATTDNSALTQISNALKRKSIAMRTAGVEVKGFLPSFEGMTNKKLEKELNNAIDRKYASFMEEIYDTTKVVEFSTTSEMSGDFLSVLMHFKESSALFDEKVASFVIDTQKEKIIRINDILGVNGVSLCNDMVKKTVDKDISKYNSQIPPISNLSEFYVKNNQIYLLFDKYQIAPGSSGVIEIKVPIDGIVEKTVNKDAFFLKEPYNIRMVKLNEINSIFGCTFQWNGNTSEVTVIKDGKKSAVLTIGVNKYDNFQGSKKISKLLEASPEIVNGYTYVPIGFVREVLEVFYFANGNQSITFSKWK